MDTYVSVITYKRFYVGSVVCALCRLREIKQTLSVGYSCVLPHFSYH